MSDLPTPNPIGDEPGNGASFPAAPPVSPYGLADTTPRPPFSRLAIAGFILSCISLFIFGFVGLIGFLLSARGFRAIRRGAVRGRGLAIAGMIIGAFGFLFYAVSLFVKG
jgi:hypothetical protein